MRAFIQLLSAQGGKNPEELLLEDDDLREEFIGYIAFYVESRMENSSYILLRREAGGFSECLQ